MTMFVILCDTHDSIIDQDPSLYHGLQWCYNDVPKILRFKEYNIILKNGLTIGLSKLIYSTLCQNMAS
jgi:hypothetical protein